jgi:hypothetical protein
MRREIVAHNFRASVVSIASAIVCLLAAQAAAVDVPTWQVGDWWNFNRSFDVSFNTTTPLNMAFSLGTTARARSNSSGQFDLQLRAPNRDDNSPSNDDAGSFGLEVVAQGVGRKVITLRLGLPPAATRRSWASYR